MPKTLCCTTCDRFVPRAGNPAVGDCRARPPVPLMVGVENKGFGQRPLVESYCPTVSKGFFCGEHPLAPKRVMLVQVVELETVESGEPILDLDGVLKVLGPADVIRPREDGEGPTPNLADLETKGRS